MRLSRSRSAASYRILAAALVASLLLPGPAAAVKVMTYNALNYPGASGAVREPSFRTVFQAIHPDVVVMQEMQSQVGVDQFKANVLDVVFPGEYVGGPFVNGPDTDNMIYYRAAACSLISHIELGTALRNISRYQLRMNGYSSTAADLYFYSCHLKASTGAANEALRLAEATIMRNDGNTLPAGTRIIYGGDFNCQDSLEAGYKVLVDSQADNDGRCHDPINKGGQWNNNVAMALYHTQSPINTANPYGGATGGMDDRFDFLLSSTALLSKEGLSYVAGTYKTFGNDGLHCCNAAINDAPTIPEGTAMANALEDASDHLPVIMTLQVPPKVDVLASLNFGTIIVGGPNAVQNLAVGNSAVVPADELNYSLVAPIGFTSPGGGFLQNAGAPATNQTITMLSTTVGNKAGNLVVTSDDVDVPAKNVALSGVVLAHAVPGIPLAGGGTLDTLDWGTHEIGSFADQTATIQNSGYSSLQAPLDVWDAAISGTDASRFSFMPAFSPATIGATPASWTIHFDDTAAIPGTYVATLTFSTRDQQGIPGATDRADVTFELTARVSSASGVAENTPPAVTQLLGNYPNPFNPTTTIAFHLSEPTDVRLAIYDVSGRFVRRLVHGDVVAGRYAILWDGTDDQGAPVGSGVYFYRLEAGTLHETRSMVMMK